MPTSDDQGEISLERVRAGAEYFTAKGAGLQRQRIFPENVSTRAPTAKLVLEEVTVAKGKLTIIVLTWLATIPRTA